MFRRGFAISLFAAALLLVPAAAASAAPELEVPAGINSVGDVFVGDSNTLTITLESVGTDPVTVGATYIYQAINHPWFSIQSDGCNGETLDPDETCEIVAGFTPSETGLKYTSLVTQSDDPAGDRFYNFQGSGVDPGIDVSPASYDFGNVEIGHNGTAKTFEIESVGTTPLSSDPEITGTDADQFFFTTQPDCSSSYPDEVCEVTVNLRPLGSPGPRSANLVINNNTKSENPVTIPLTATAVQGHLATDPSTVAFGNVDAYTSPAPNRTLTLSNDGSADLTINDIDMHEGTANSYILDVDECTDNLVLAPGEDCSLNVTFKAGNVAAGTGESAVSIYTSVGNTAIPVTATLIEGEIDLSSESVDLGDVELGHSATAVLNIYSTGTAPLIFSPGTPTLLGPDDSMFDVNMPNSCTGLTNAGLFCQVVVTFTPTSLSGKSASARFEGNFGTVDVPLGGNGIEAFANLPLNEDFGQIKVGDTKTITMTVVSNGDVPLNLDAPGIAGSDASFFSASFKNGSCINKVRGEECDIQLTYKPTATGSHEATLELTGNINQTVPLTGSAREPTPAKVSLKLSAPQQVWGGKNVTFTAKISKSGEQPTGPLILSTVVPKKLAGTVKAIRIPALGTGNRTVTKTIKIKVRKAAKKAGELKVRVRVSGTGIKPAPATVIWRMRKRPEFL